jgi:hypothetical protein
VTSPGPYIAVRSAAILHACGYGDPGRQAVQIGLLCAA